MNNRQDNHTDRLFREKLSGARVSPSPRAWDGIAGGLDQEDRKRRRAAWIWWSAAASLLLLMTVGFILFLSGDKDNKGVSNSFAEDRSPADTNLRPSDRSPKLDDKKADTFALNREESSSAPKANILTNESGIPASKANRNASQTGGKHSLTPQLRKPKATFAENLLGREDFQTPTNPILSKLGQPTLDPRGVQIGQKRYGLEKGFAFKAIPQDQEGLQPNKEQIEAPSEGDLIPLLEEAFAHHEEKADSRNDKKKREKKKRKQRWKMGGQFSPDYALASSAAPPGSPSIFSNAADLNASLKREATPTYPSFAFTTGLNVGYEVSDRVDIQSGVLYSSRLGNSQAVYSYQRSGASFATTESVEANYNFTFLEVPLRVKYDVVQKDRFNYYVSSGVSGNLFLDYKANLDSEISNQTLDLGENASTLQPSQLNVLVSTGVEYKLAKDLSINFEPTLRLNAVTSDYSFAKNAPGSLSLNTGVNYRF